jgi:hypothetical protein
MNISIFFSSLHTFLSFLLLRHLCIIAIMSCVLKKIHALNWATNITTTLYISHTQHQQITEIKQALTFLHFLSLLGTAIVYMAHAEGYQARAVILAFGTFVLAFCIPPIGMIQPEDAPDATRKALGWMPERGDLNELKKEMLAEEEKRKEKGKKKGGKKND